MDRQVFEGILAEFKESLPKITEGRDPFLAKMPDRYGATKVSMQHGVTKISMQHCLDMVCLHLDVSPVAIRGKRKMRRLTHARWLFMLLASEFCEETGPEVADFIHKDVSNNSHAIRRLQTVMQTNAKLKDAYHAIRKEFEAFA